MYSFKMENNPQKSPTTIQDPPSPPYPVITGPTGPTGMQMASPLSGKRSSQIINSSDSKNTKYYYQCIECDLLAPEITDQDDKQKCQHVWIKYRQFKD